MRAAFALDYPGCTSATFDAASLARLEAMLAAHREAGGAVVAATHQDFVLPGAATLELTG